VFDRSGYSQARFEEIKMCNEGAMMKRAFSVVVLLAAVMGSCRAADGDDAERPKEIRLADLLALPDREYRVDPYLKAAESHQSMGKEKAYSLLLELAAKDEFDTRTVSLCRMLFQAKPKSTFRRTAIGAAYFLGGTDYEDWPLEPIEIVDGVPFRIVRGYLVLGKAEPLAAYLRYCREKCRWSSFKFKSKSRLDKQQALDKLLSSPKWKEKLEDGDRVFFEAQVK
jgi:hypothetical protein